MNMLHTEVLDKKRQQLLPSFLSLKGKFYLAGETALALLLNHRDSIDFDFFSEQSFSPEVLYEKLQKIFSLYSLKIVQEEKDTLTILLDNEVKISFFAYPYKLQDAFIETEYLHLASLIDIGCMKLQAIISRSTLKDYVYLYFILHEISLQTLLSQSQQKFPQIDKNLILKSLVYFDDLDLAPLHFMKGKEVSLENMKHFLQTQVKTYVLNAH